MFWLCSYWNRNSPKRSITNQTRKPPLSDGYGINDQRIETSGGQVL